MHVDQAVQIEMARSLKIERLFFVSLSRIPCVIKSSSCNDVIVGTDVVRSIMTIVWSKTGRVYIACSSTLRRISISYKYSKE